MARTWKSGARNPEWHRDNMNRWKRKKADLAKSPVSRKVLKGDSPEGLKEESLRLRRVQAEQKAKWIKDDAVLERIATLGQNKSR